MCGLFTTSLYRFSPETFDSNTDASNLYLVPGVLLNVISLSTLEQVDSATMLVTNVFVASLITV